MDLVSRLQTLNKILQNNASKKPANTRFHEQRDKCNTKLFFLANKETEFFFSENLFLKFQKIRSHFHAFWLSHHWPLDKLMFCYQGKQTHTSATKFCCANCQATDKRLMRYRARISPNIKFLECHPDDISLPCSNAANFVFLNLTPIPQNRTNSPKN